jgi:hypothetical protein
VIPYYGVIIKRNEAISNKYCYNFIREDEFQLGFLFLSSSSVFQPVCRKAGWAAVSGGRFSNPPTSQSAIVGRNLHKIETDISDSWITFYSGPKRKTHIADQPDRLSTWLLVVVTSLIIVKRL